MDAGRKAAFAALQALEHGASWEEALRRAASQAPSRSREGRFGRELLSGTVRLRGKLDWMLQKVLDRFMVEVDGIGQAKEKELMEV